MPQGSVLGPTLWNVLYNAVLTAKMPRNCQLFAFADDSALMVAAEEEQELVQKANEALAIVKHNMS